MIEVGASLPQKRGSDRANPSTDGSNEGPFAARSKDTRRHTRSEISGGAVTEEHDLIIRRHWINARSEGDVALTRERHATCRNAPFLISPSPRLPALRQRCA